MYRDGENGGGGGGTQDPPKTDPPDTGKMFSEKYVQDLRSEAATHRVKAVELQNQVNALTNEKTALSTEVVTLRTQVQETALQNKVVTALVAAGASKPEAVYKLIREQLKPNEKNELVEKDLNDVIEKAQKEVPELFSGNRVPPTKVDVTPENGQVNKNAGMNQLIRNAIGR